MKIKLENLIVVNKEELEHQLSLLQETVDKGNKLLIEGKYEELAEESIHIQGANRKIRFIKQLLQSSKALKPFVEDAFDDSGEFHIKLEESTDYLSYDYEIDKNKYLNKEIEW